MRALCSALLLMALLTTASGCSRLGGAQANASRAGSLAAGGPVGRLQEVSPPAAVQQLRQALDQRRPQLAITAPQDGSLIPGGSWTLQIRGCDWPLADAGALGLGAHLAVQVDAGAPRRLTGASSDGESFTLDVPMEPLAPGSHRITVTTVRPWGEVVKSPGAAAQIRLHRLAVNPLGLPAPGSPQLIVASPAELSAAEPLLLDWLLLDAPLQGLREGDGRWRLRVTINGDSFLVDQNAPLWLRGWRHGSNSLLMELVDERGEPLNPPFNTLVREVVVDPDREQPRWLGAELSEQELAQLLGSAPPAAESEERGELEEPESELPAPRIPAADSSPSPGGTSEEADADADHQLDPEPKADPSDSDREPQPQPDQDPLEPAANESAAPHAGGQPPDGGPAADDQPEPSA
jgi:hypothetical protein